MAQGNYDFSSREWELIDMVKKQLISLHTMEKMLWKEGFLDLIDIDLEDQARAVQGYHYLYPN